MTTTTDLPVSQEMTRNPIEMISTTDLPAVMSCEMTCVPIEITSPTGLPVAVSREITRDPIEMTSTSDLPVQDSVSKLCTSLFYGSKKLGEIKNDKISVNDVQRRSQRSKCKPAKFSDVND